MGLVNNLNNLKAIKTDNIITEDSYIKVNLSNMIKDELENAKTFKFIAFYFDVFKTGENMVLLMLVLDQEGNYKLTKTYDEEILKILLGENHYIGLENLIEHQIKYIKEMLLAKTFNSFNKFEDNDLTYLSILQKKVSVLKSKDVNKVLKYVLKKYSMLSHFIDRNNNFDNLINKADVGEIFFK